VVGTAQKLIGRMWPPQASTAGVVGRPDEGRRPEEAKPPTNVPHIQAR
jgi:hypothetical protein